VLSSSLLPRWLSLLNTPSPEQEELEAITNWIVYREKQVVRLAIWVVLMMVLDFWTASLYAFIALQTSGGDWQRF
jgi:hypothetical protein